MTAPIPPSAVQNADVLRQVRDAPGRVWTSGQLADAVGRDRSNIVKGFEPLARAGLITVETRPANGYALELTPLGRQILDGLDLAQGLAPGGGPAALPWSSIDPNPDNPRKRYDDADLAEMADSIVAHGVLQPLTVLPAGADGRHRLVFGERRWRGTGLAIADGRLPADYALPVQVRDLPPGEALTLMMIENLQRAEMDPIDEGLGLAHLCRLNAWTVREAAAAIGRPVATLGEKMRTAENAKPDDVAAFRRGDLTWRDLRARVRDLSPKLLLALAELVHAIEYHGQGEPREIEVDPTKGGAFPELVSRALVARHQPKCLHPRVFAYLTATAIETLQSAGAYGPDHGLGGWAPTLFRLRGAVLGDGPAKELARLDRYASPWLCTPPPSMGEGRDGGETATLDDEAGAADDGQPEDDLATYVAAPIPDSFRDQLRRALADDPEVTPIDPVSNPRDRLALLEIAHKVAEDPHPRHPGTAVGAHWTDAAIQTLAAAGLVVLAPHGEDGWTIALTPAGDDWLLAHGVEALRPDAVQLAVARVNAGVESVNAARYATSGLNPLPAAPPDPGGSPATRESPPHGPAPGGRDAGETAASDDDQDPHDAEAHSAAKRLLARVWSSLPRDGPAHYEVLFAQAGLPLPWREDPHNPGLVRAASGAIAATADHDGEQPDALATAQAALIALAVNSLGGVTPEQAP